MPLLAVTIIPARLSAENKSSPCAGAGALFRACAALHQESVLRWALMMCAHQSALVSCLS